MLDGLLLLGGRGDWAFVSHPPAGYLTQFLMVVAEMQECTLKQ